MASIIFGWYTTKIKSYTPKELELDDLHPDYQVRQRIFHIMYIPVLPIGKVYAFKQDNKFYKASDSVRQRIKERKGYKTPWYSFTLPILAVVISTIAIAYDFYKDSSDKKAYEEFYNQLTQEESEQLNQLTPNHYILLADIKSTYMDAYCLKVLKVEGHEVHLMKSEEILSEKEPYELIDYFQQNKDGLEVMIVSIDELKALICRDSKSYHDEVEDNLCGRELFDDGKKYVIKSIDYYEGPIFERPSKATAFSSDGNEIISLKLTNKGEPAKLIEITDIAGNTKWKTSQLNETFEYQKYQSKKLIIDGEKYKQGPFKLRIVFEDLKGKTFKFIIEQDLDTKIYAER